MNAAETHETVHADSGMRYHLQTTTCRPLDAIRADPALSRSSIIAAWPSRVRDLGRPLQPLDGRLSPADGDRFVVDETEEVDGVT